MDQGMDNFNQFTPFSEGSLNWYPARELRHSGRKQSIDEETIQGQIEYWIVHQQDGRLDTCSKMGR